MAEPRKKSVENPKLHLRIKDARDRLLKLSQAEFAKRMGVSQSNVSRWESGLLPPEREHLLKLSTLLNGMVESLYFMEEAGVPREFFYGDDSVAAATLPTELWTPESDEIKRSFLYAPLLRDPAAAGSPRAISPSEVETVLPIHRKFVEPGSSLVALRVKGQSMSPVLEDGYIVIVDMAHREPKRLVGKMVVARYGNEVTIKWLRELKGRYLLVPQHTSPRFDIQELDSKDGWAPVGEVIHWMGFPPPRTRK